MGYRNNVSIIVGRKLEQECEALRTKYSGNKDALNNLVSILDNKEVSPDGTLVRYHHDDISWPDWPEVGIDGEYAAIQELEQLIYDHAYDNTEGYEASFLRQGDDSDDVQQFGGDNLQWVDIVCPTFTTVYAITHVQSELTPQYDHRCPEPDAKGTVRFSYEDAVKELNRIATAECNKRNGHDLIIDDDKAYFRAVIPVNYDLIGTRNVQVSHYFNIVELKF